MDETTVRVLSDLARMHENQAKGAGPGQAEYFRGGAAALRMAMQFLAGPPVVTNGRSKSPEDDVEGLYVCPECEASYNTPQAVGVHRRKAHGVPGASRRRP